MKSRSFAAALSLLLILVCGLYSLRYAAALFASPPSIYLDHDNSYIVAGLKTTPHLADTLKWFSGSWSAENVPYFRPLSSLAFWLEYRAFGDDGLRGFTVVLCLSHLAILFTAFWFLNRICSRRLALLAVCLFALSLPAWLGLPYASDATVNWKDSVEQWYLLPYLLACGGWVGLLQKADGPHLRRYLAVAACFLIAIGFKESAYTFPFVAALLAWHQGALRTHWRGLAGFFAVAALCLAWRTYALGGHGYRFGSNGSWPARWFMDAFGGEAAVYFLRKQLTVPAIALAAWTLCLALRRKYGASIATMLLAACCVQIAAWSFPRSVAETLGDLFFLPAWRGAAMTLFMAYGYWMLLAKRDRLHIFAYGWVLLTYLPLMLGPNTPHVYYAVSLGWSLWIACVAARLADRAMATREGLAKAKDAGPGEVPAVPLSGVNGAP